MCFISIKVYKVFIKEYFLKIFNDFCRTVKISKSFLMKTIKSEL